jgi:hypothetical protein
MALLQPTGALGLDPDDVDAWYSERFAALTDDALFDVAAAVIAVPRRDPADSFGLHAPLELMARRELLELAPPSRREPIRRRMVWVAAKYETIAESASPPRERAFDSIGTARDALVDATGAGDLDAVDAIAAWFTVNASTDDVVALAPALVDSLSAAGHASIYFSLLPRVAAHSQRAHDLLRPLVHEVARVPSLRVEWVHAGVTPANPDADELARSLAHTPRLGLPGTDFIFPLVHQIDANGVARAVVEPRLPLDVDAAAGAILRVAALSMLGDDPQYAPYGWSHCLTLPQAVLNVTPRLPDPTVGLAIAATYVAAFRAGEAAHDLDVAARPEPVEMDPFDALDARAPVAAAAVFHASDAELARILPELAARAGQHEDAHVAKYTLACIDAARGDVEHRSLYIAGAASLGAWWATGA